MKIITRYILKRLSLSFLFVTVILTITVWLTQSLKLIDGFINRGISLLIFFKLLLLLLPDLIGIILPISLLIAILYTYNRLLTDNELIVLRSMSLSDLFLIRPALILSMTAIGILYALNLYFLPLAFQKSKDLEFQIRNKINVNMIQSGEFNAFKGIMVYVRSRQKDDTLIGILLHDTRNSQKPYSVAAEFGKVINTDEGTKLILVNGNRQEKDLTSRVPSILSFDQYSINLNTQDSSLQTRSRKPHEMFLSELLDPKNTATNQIMQSKFLAEAHQRLIMPLISMVFALIALSIFLGGNYNRRSRSKKIMGITLICVMVEGVILILINLGGKIFMSITITYFLVFMMIFMPLLYFIRGSQFFIFNRKR